MGMSKKDFIALADAIKWHNETCGHTDWSPEFVQSHLDTLAQFCKQQNSNFKRERWLGYIAGENGPNGGNVKVRA